MSFPEINSMIRFSVCLSLQPLCLPASCGCTGGLVQGASIAGEIAGGPQQGLTAIAGGGAVRDI